jgi:hypothetical protein
MWVPYATRLHKISFGDRKLGIDRLQPTIIEQRNLDSVVRRQRDCEQLGQGAPERIGVTFGANPFHIFVEPIFRCNLDRAKSTVVRERRAARDNQAYGKSQDRILQQFISRLNLGACRNRHHRMAMHRIGRRNTAGVSDAD